MEKAIVGSLALTAGCGSVELTTPSSQPSSTAKPKQDTEPINSRARAVCDKCQTVLLDGHREAEALRTDIVSMARRVISMNRCGQTTCDVDSPRPPIDRDSPWNAGSYYTTTYNQIGTCDAEAGDDMKKASDCIVNRASIEDETAESNRFLIQHGQACERFDDSIMAYLKENCVPAVNRTREKIAWLRTFMDRLKMHYKALLQAKSGKEELERERAKAKAEAEKVDAKRRETELQAIERDLDKK